MFLHLCLQHMVEDFPKAKRQRVILMLKGVKKTFELSCMLHLISAEELEIVFAFQL